MPLPWLLCKKRELQDGFEPYWLMVGHGSLSVT